MKSEKNPYLQYSDPKQQRKNVQSLFNSIAARYDIVNTLLSFGIDYFWRSRAVKSLYLDKNSYVLDLATGTGKLAHTSLKKTPCKVMGVDPAFNMLKKTNKKLKPVKGSFFPVQAFGEYLPLSNEVFTHAMIAYGIRNVSQRPKVFQEIHRTLKKGGRFLILEFSEPKNKFFSKLYRFYFHTILTKIGGLISGDFNAYNYLPKSVDSFVTPDELASELSNTGFRLETKKSLTFGISTMMVFLKE